MADEFLSEEEEAEPAEACQWCTSGAVRIVGPTLMPMAIVARSPTGSIAEWLVCPDCYLALLRLKAERGNA